MPAQRYSACKALCGFGMQGFNKDELNTERFLNLRYDGTDVPVMTLCTEGGDYAQASPVVMSTAGQQRQAIFHGLLRIEHWNNNHIKSTVMLVITALNCSSVTDNDGR